MEHDQLVHEACAQDTAACRHETARGNRPQAVKDMLELGVENFFGPGGELVEGPANFDAGISVGMAPR